MIRELTAGISPARRSGGLVRIVGRANPDCLNAIAVSDPSMELESHVPMLLSRGAASSASASAIPFKPAQTNPRLNLYPRRPLTPHCHFLPHQLIPPTKKEFSTSFDTTHTLHKQEQTWHFQAKVTVLVAVVLVVAGIINKGLLLLLDIGATPLLLPSKATAIPKDRLNTSKANTILRNSSTTLPSKAMAMAAPLRSNNTNTSLPAPINSPATVLRAGQALLCHKEHNSSDMEHHKAIRSSTVTVPESGRRC